MKHRTPRPPRSGLTALAGWSITWHALDRAVQRGISREEIITAIHQPSKILVTRKNFATTERRERDGVAVVVDRRSRRIVTVAPQRRPTAA